MTYTAVNSLHKCFE